VAGVVAEHNARHQPGRTYLVHGGQPQEIRDRALAVFRKEGGMLTATFGALAVGVNLQCARVVVMHDIDWTPATMLQAEARVWRQGQANPVISYWVVAKDSVEALVVRHILKKADVVASTLGDEEPRSLGELFSDVASDIEDNVLETVRKWQSWRN